MSEHENPPAFPTTKPLDGWGDPNQGMTLRDWFAGQALVCSAAVARIIHDAKGGSGFTEEQAAATAYRIADAMLSARATGQ